MRKLISTSTYTSKIFIPQQSCNHLLTKNQYFIRSSKKNQNNKQPKINKQPNEQRKPNEQQPNSKIPLTGPKRLLQLIKSGNVSITPFYLKFFSNKLNNPSMKFKKNQKLTQQKKQDSAHKAFEQNVNKLEKQKQLQKNLNKPLYPFIPSHLFRQRLMKKYKIVQALKASKKLQKEKFTEQFFNFADLTKVTAQKQHFQRFLLIYGLSILALALYTTNSQDSFIPSTGWQVPQNQQLSDNQILSRLNQIQQILVKPSTSNNYKITLVFKQKRSLTIFDHIFQLLGMDIQQNKTRVYETQNPNNILDGLQRIQQNKNTQDWIKVKPILQKYSFINAVFDSLFLATPFIGIGITYWIFRRINPESMMSNFTSKKKSMKIQSLKDIKVRFKDVAGMEGAKKQITEFVDFLKKSQKYSEMGAKIPKGALLTGPPGTGKTMLAKACAGQAGTSFFYVSGSQFVQMFVGLGASRVRQLFARARQQAPSIIFIDQIDAIGKKRQTSRNEQKDSTLNQMLVEMDGFSSHQTVIVLAATNRKDILDSALTRPGRFDRIVQITLPEIKARQDIFMVHLAPLKINPERTLSDIAKRLAQLTPGFSGADIANLCNQAAIIATRKNRTYIEDADFQQASQRIMAGYVKKGLSNEKTRKRVAYHQAGHAVCGWFLRGGDPLVKLTIIPRSKGALGYAQYLPKTAYIRTKSDLIDQLSIMLGGTTSQQVFLGNMSSGNSDDLQKVYSLSRRMITQFGMGARTYNITLDQQTYVKKQSQQLCNLMEEQVMQIVNQASKRAKKIIQDKRDIVEELAKELLQKETINSEDILRIMGERPVFA